MSASQERSHPPSVPPQRVLFLDKFNRMSSPKGSRQVSIFPVLFPGKEKSFFVIDMAAELLRYNYTTGVRIVGVA